MHLDEKTSVSFIQDSLDILGICCPGASCVMNYYGCDRFVLDLCSASATIDCDSASGQVKSNAVQRRNGGAAPEAVHSNFSPEDGVRDFRLNGEITRDQTSANGGFSRTMDRVRQHSKLLNRLL